LPYETIFEVDETQVKIQELERKTLAPGFWNNPDAAKKTQQEISRLQDPLKEWESCQADLDEAGLLLELAMEAGDQQTAQEAADLLTKLENRIVSTEMERMFSGEHDASNAILAINAGAGGTEAQDWTSILLRMYLRWAESKGFSVDILDQLPGDEAGVKNVTMMINGRYAYGQLRSEMGIHRLVRISPFDAGGRRHTSFASVHVFPELDDSIVIDINEKDLRVDTYRASGSGGQHVNKTSSAVRLTHLPTGLVAQCQNERSQHRNKDTAMKMLKAQLYERERGLQEEAKEKMQGVKKEIAWGSQIRSYVLQPYQLIKDHRTNYEAGNVASVLDGGLDPFIKAYLLWEH
jgi:peptide chain release factor 2